MMIFFMNFTMKINGTPPGFINHIDHSPSINGTPPGFINRY